MATPVEVVRNILDRLIELRDPCARRLLKQRELAATLQEIEQQIEKVLTKDSPPYRVFDRMRAERDRWWRAGHEYVDGDDCRHLKDWIAIATAVLKELDPSAVPAEDLIRDIEGQKALMISVATGGPQIKEVNPEYIERRDRIGAALRDRNLKDPNPHDDLWAWYAKWSSGDLPSYKSRRQYIGELYGALLDQLKKGPPSRGAEIFTEPTGWAKVDRNIASARQQLESAKTEVDFQQVGLICRETLIDLAQIVFDKNRHPIADGVDVSKTDAKRMLDAYISVELAGGSNEIARKHAKASLDLANQLTHDRTADFRTAAVCAEATTSVVNIVAIISGQRDPDK